MRKTSTGFAYDALPFHYEKKSVRNRDANGFLHISVSPFTKVQVAPYYGREVPDYVSLGLDPDKVYYGYRSAKELSKPETVNSANGIPVQLSHHPDFANAPAKDTRVGATGTDAKWQDPYLTNSLVVFDEEAQKAIESGKMREISMAYRYKPRLESGEALGQKYDFIMEDINFNHCALVNTGRAGGDVLVLDSNSIEESKKMDKDNLKEKADVLAEAKDEVPPVDPSQNSEERLAVLEHEYQEMKQMLDKLMAVEKEEGHKELQDGEDDEDGIQAPEVRIEKDAEPKGVEDPDVKGETEELPFDKEDAEDKEEIPEDLGEKEPENEKEEDFNENSDDVEGEELEQSQETEEKDDESDESDDVDTLVRDAIKACGLDGEPAEIQEAYAAGIKYGLGKLKGKPEKAEEPKDKLGQDSAMDVHQAAKDMLSAMQRCRAVLGDIKVDAYDSAESIYVDALKALGVKKVAKEEARTAYEMFTRGRKAMAKTMAQDVKAVDSNDGLLKILNKVNTSI